MQPSLFDAAQYVLNFDSSPQSGEEEIVETFKRETQDVGSEAEAGQTP